MQVHVTIHVVLERALLRAADQAARKTKINRSAFIRDALREHLKRLRTHDLEGADRAGYERIPQGAEDDAWDAVVTWPER